MIRALLLVVVFTVSGFAGEEIPAGSPALSLSLLCDFSSQILPASELFLKSA